MGPHQGRVEGEENLPRPIGHTLLNVPQDFFCLYLFFFKESHLQILWEVAVAQRNKLSTVIQKIKHLKHTVQTGKLRNSREASTSFSCHFHTAASDCIQANPDTANTVTAKLYGIESVRYVILNKLNSAVTFLLLTLCSLFHSHLQR